MHASPFNDTRRLHFRIAVFGCIDFAQSVNRLAERVDHPAEQFFADRHADDAVGATDNVAFADSFVGTEQNDADIVFFQVKSHSLNSVGKFHHFVIADIIQTVYAGNAVADGKHTSDFGYVRPGFRAGDLGL